MPTFTAGDLIPIASVSKDKYGGRTWGNDVTKKLICLCLSLLALPAAAQPPHVPYSDQPILSMSTTRVSDHAGVVYVFRSKRSDRLKLLWWDGTGVVLYAKRLEQGAFCWPKVQDGAMRLTSAQLTALLDGMEWMRVLAPRRTRAPQVVA